MLLMFNKEPKITKRISALLILLLALSSCATLFIPKSQKITFITKSDSSVVYLNGQEFGRGEKIIKPIKRKTGNALIVVKTPGHKDIHTVLIQGRRPHAFAPLCILSLATIFGLPFDIHNENLRVYNKIQNVNFQEEFISREPFQKYITIDDITLKVNDINKDLRWYYINHGQDIEKEIKRQDILANAELLRQEKLKKSAKKQLVTEEKNNTVNDTKYTEFIDETLKESMFIDTINKIFQDLNNTIFLEGVMNKANIIKVETKTSYYYKARINAVWYIKNFHGEKIDSIINMSYSGEYYYGYPYRNFDEIKQRMFADAVDKSFGNILKNEKMNRYLLSDSNMSIQDEMLQIKKPTNFVTGIDDASKACVIVKRKDKGHGSGFAISNDGYILTNFHVVAGNMSGKPSEITVILENGEEIEAEVIRYNPMRDIALIKVDYNFENAFLIPPKKTFKRLMNVYTIGTPKSIELGQTTSSGIMSNERKANNNFLIQLNMSVNSGNSGGPLFDKIGTLHGVIQSKLVGFATEGISFAIPSSSIPEYLNLKID